MLAVIEPVCPLVRSVIELTSPAGESWIEICSVSPASMNSTCAGSGVKVARVAFSGSGGACGTPSLVMNAKSAHSSPARFRQSALFTCVRVADRPNTTIAAHHRVGSQDMFGSGTQPGG
jgi:hypothetical protein